MFVFFSSWYGDLLFVVVHSGTPSKPYPPQCTHAFMTHVADMTGASSAQNTSGVCSRTPSRPTRIAGSRSTGVDSRSLWRRSWPSPTSPP